MNSQESSTPPNTDVPPAATPATSTPKPRSFQATAPTPSSSSSRGAMRPALTFSSSGEPQSVTRKASLAVNTVVLGGKSRVITTTQRTPLNSVPNTQAAPERYNGKRNNMRQAAYEQPKPTASNVPAATRRHLSEEKNPDCAVSKSKATSKSKEQTTKTNESQLNAKKANSRTKQPSKLSTKKTQKQSAKQSGPPVSKLSNDSKSKLSTKKPSSLPSASAVTTRPPTTSTSTASHTMPPTDSVSKTSTAKKSGYQALASPDPYDIASPVLDYNMPTEVMQENLATAKKHNMSKSSNLSSRTLNTSRPILTDITNQSIASGGATQLNRGGQQRVFNLSAAPLKSHKNGRGKTGRNSIASSLNSSACSELNAIPDSMPIAPNSPQSTPYNSFLDDELESKPPPTSKLRKRIQVPTNHDSFTFDSDNESDASWKLTQKAKKRSSAGSKPTAKRQYKTNTGVNGKPKPVLTGARTKKVMPKKREQPIKTVTNSKTKNTSSESSKKQSTAPRKARLQTDSIIGRKRAIDDVYDPDFTPELKPRTVATARKTLPKQKASAAAKMTENLTKKTPSLPSIGKDAAARKLIMAERTPSMSGTRKRTAPAREGKKKPSPVRESKKKQPPARESKRKQAVCVAVSPDAHDKFYYSPAIPRVSASKPDLAERAQSHSKLQGMLSPTLGLYGDGLSLVCPPSPKKPRLNHGRRNSGYCSDSHVHEPSSPSNSDHSSLAELQDNVQTNLQFAEDELQCSPTNSPQHSPKVSSVPPSPISLHSSQAEADLNITAGFQQICRDFISRSGKMGHQPVAIAGKQGIKRPKQQSKTDKLVAKKKRREQEDHWDREEEEENGDSPPPPPPPPRRAVKVSFPQNIAGLYIDIFSCRLKLTTS